MANITIPNLPAATSLNGDEQFETVQSGTSRRTTTQQIADYVVSAGIYGPIPNSTVISNISGATAEPAPNSLSQIMDSSFGDTIGDVLYRSGAGWVALAPGLDGQVLRTNGSGVAVSWYTVPGGGTVQSITAGTNISTSPSPITLSGTISTVDDPVFATSTTTPIVYGGTAASSGLTLQSTSGVGTTDSISMKVGNAGAITALGIDTSGVVTLSSALPVTSGGTGQTSALTTNGVVYGSSTTAMATTAVGTTGQVLVATTGGAPSFGAIPSTAAVTSIGFGTTGLTPVSATTGVVTVAGTLVAANGGTGQTSYTVGDLLYADTTTTLAKLADVATGSVLISGGVGVAPSYSASPTLTTSLTTPLLIGGTTASSTLTLQSTSGAGTTDKILFKVGNNGAVTGGTIGTTGNWGFGGNATTFIGLAVPLDITGATSAYGQRINGNVQSDVTTLAAAYFSNIALENASFTTTDLVHFLANPPSGGAGSTATNQYGFKANSTLGSNGAATVTNSYGFYSDLASASNKWNFYANGTAPNYFNGAVTLGTPLAVSSGGTGATTANAALTNLTTFTSTATAAGTTVLTNTSTYFQFFTGTLTETITLPVTSTLGTGWSFHIVNNSTGNLTVNSSGGNLVITVLPGLTVMCTCIGTALTTAADWEAGYTDFTTATGTGSVVLATSPTLVTPVLGVATATSLSATTLTATAGAGFQNMVVQITGTSASYSLPAAVQVLGAKLKVTIVGGGGQGGGTTTTAGQEGGGGGGGATVVVFLDYVSGQNTLTYTVGPGGSGAGTNAAGTAGTASSIIYNGITYTANGGGGGPTAATTGSGVGGAASGGTLNISGQNGGAGGTAAATNSVIGSGGDSSFGFGAQAPSATGTGTAATSGFGGGGSGGHNSATATARAGGAGAAGVVIIEY